MYALLAELVKKIIQKLLPIFPKLRQSLMLTNGQNKLFTPANRAVIAIILNRKIQRASLFQKSLGLLLFDGRPSVGVLNN